MIVATWCAYIILRRFIEERILCVRNMGSCLCKEKKPSAAMHPRTSTSTNHIYPPVYENGQNGSLNHGGRSQTDGNLPANRDTSLPKNGGQGSRTHAVGVTESHLARSTHQTNSTER